MLLNNIILNLCLKVSVLEEKLCDFKRWRWTPFDEHIDHFNLTKMNTGKVMMMTVIMMTIKTMMMLVLMTAEIPFDEHIDHINFTKMNIGKVMLMMMTMTMMPIMKMRNNIIIIIMAGTSNVAHRNRLRGGHPRGGPVADEEPTEN